jgi:hypothetical protein
MTVFITKKATHCALETTNTVNHHFIYLSIIRNAILKSSQERVFVPKDMKDHRKTSAQTIDPHDAMYRRVNSGAWSMETQARTTPTIADTVAIIIDLSHTIFLPKKKLVTQGHLPVTTPTRG